LETAATVAEETARAGTAPEGIPAEVLAMGPGRAATRRAVLTKVRKVAIKARRAAPAKEPAPAERKVAAAPRGRDRAPVRARVVVLEAEGPGAVAAVAAALGVALEERPTAPPKAPEL